MLNKQDTILQALKSLNLSMDEAKIYTELLKGPATHLSLARVTGINRTKVYRIADDLEKRSLISTRIDDRGTSLVAADPTTLEVELVTREEKLRNQRIIFSGILPALTQLQDYSKSPLTFAVHTYEGVSGFKQMLWHELKTESEMLIFGSGKLESLVGSVQWSEKHRLMTVKAGYTVRELINPGKKDDIFTKNAEFMESYTKLPLDEDVLTMEHQIAIYNNTVATYCWRGDQKVGFEVVNTAYAHMLRQIFEHYWQLAS